MADLLKRLQISEQQYGVGMEDNPFHNASPDECMNVCFGGSGGGSPPPPPPSTVTQQTSNIPEYFQPYLERLFERAEGVTTEPFQRYEGQRLAQTTPEQQAAYQGVEELVGGYKPYLETADLLTAQASQQSTDPTAVAARMNPYQQAVIDIQKREAMRDAEKLQQQIGAQAVGAGAYGGSRQALIESELARQQGQRLADIQAVGSQQAYDKAMEQLASDRAASLAAGQQFATLGGQQQQLGLAGLGALETVGGTRQAQQQKALDIAYEDFARETTRPSQQVQEMSSVLRGFNLPVSTYTTAQQQVQQPGLGQQLLGAGLGVYGLGSQFGLFKEGGNVQKYKGQGLVERSIFYPFTEAYKKETTGKDYKDLVPRSLTKEYKETARKVAEKDPETLRKLGIEGPIMTSDISKIEDFRAPLEIEDQERGGGFSTGDPTPSRFEGYMGAEPTGGILNFDDRPQGGFDDYYVFDKEKPKEPRLPEINRPQSKEIKLTGSQDISYEDIFKAPVNVETIKPGEDQASSTEAPQPTQQTPEQYAASAVSPLREDIRRLREESDKTTTEKKEKGKMPGDLIAQIGLNLMTGDPEAAPGFLSQVGAAVKPVLPEAVRRRERTEDLAAEERKRAEDREFKLMGLEADVTGREADIASRERISQRDIQARKEQLQMQITSADNQQARELRFKADENSKKRKVDLLELQDKQRYDEAYLNVLQDKTNADFVKLQATRDIEMAKLEIQDQLMEMERNKVTLDQSAATQKQKNEIKKLETEQLKAINDYLYKMGIDEKDPFRISVEAKIKQLFLGGGSGIPGVKG